MWFNTQPDDQLFLPGKMAAPELLVPPPPQMANGYTGPAIDQDKYEIDWTHPLTQNLDVAILFTAGKIPRCLVRPERTFTSTALPDMGHLNGHGFNETDEFWLMSNPGIRHTSQMSLACRPTFFDNTGTQYQYVVSTGGFNTADAFNLYLGEESQGASLNENDLKWNVDTFGTAGLSINNYWPSRNGQHIVANFNYSRGNDACRLWANGVDLSFSNNNTQSDCTGVVRDMYIGKRSDSESARYFGGTLDYLFFWDGRELSPAEVAEFHSNPYCFLKPKAEIFTTYTPDVRFPLADARAEMPSLWIPNRQPTAPVTIDWEHPLTEGLLLCAMPGANYNENPVNNLPPEVAGTAWVRHREGVLFDGTGGNRLNYETNRANVRPYDDQFTMYAIGARTGANDFRLMTTSSSSSNSNHTSIRIRADGELECRMDDSSSDNICITSGRNVQDWEIIKMAHIRRSQNDADLVELGTITASNGVNGTLNANQGRINFGCTFKSTSTYTPGWALFGAMWNRPLSLAELAMLDANPYCFLIPE